MLTRYAEKHGVGEQAAKLVGRLMARPRAQLALANASGWFPANTDAAASRCRPAAAASGRSATRASDGVTMPNLPQAAAVWAPYGDRLGRDDERAGRHAGQAGLPARRTQAAIGDDRAGVSGFALSGDRVLTFSLALDTRE